MNIRKKSFIKLLLCTFMIVNSSCQDFSELQSGESDSCSAVSLTCSRSVSWYDSRTGGTRALIDNDGSGDFMNGDRIGVFVSGTSQSAYQEMSFDGKEWTPSLQRSTYGSGELKVSAIFPVLSEINETEREVVIPADQSLEDKYIMADVLYGGTLVGEGMASSSLSFSHALHKLCINLKGDIPDDIQLEVRSRTEGVISITDGSVTLKDRETYTWIKPLRQNGTTYVAILLPQDVLSYQESEGLIRITSGEKSAIYKLDKSIKSFSPGIQTTLNLTINLSESGGGVDMDFSNQKLWVYGVSSPVFPGKENIKSYSAATWVTDFGNGEWLRMDYSKSYPPLPNEEEYLTWIEGCGWYDCNKTFSYKEDGYMCWAATASNLLHWWLEHNKSYVEAYYSKYGGEHCPMEYRRMTERDQNHSEIFNYFKKWFTNIGSLEDVAVNWFINGYDVGLAYNYNRDFKGFFNKVFEREDFVAVETRKTTKENFNLWIKDAFLNNKAISFSVYGFNGPSSKLHAMTIWGAEFDADGNVCNIYFCDNNYGEYEPNHASLSRYKIVYDNSNVQGTYITPLDNNDGTQSNAKALVSSVSLVDLRQDIWKKAFPEINN